MPIFIPVRNRIAFSLIYQSFPLQGKCGDNRPATGSGTYQTGKVNEKRLGELSSLLERLRRCSLDRRVLAKHERQSLALQCQWTIARALRAFAQDNLIAEHSPIAGLLCRFPHLNHSLASV